MKKLLIAFFFLKTVVFAGIPITGDYLSPSEEIVKRDSWKVIERHVEKTGMDRDTIAFLQAIAANETWGHIGYHGAMQGFRIYQDIIRFTIEEILQIPIREDFHFLRVPGDPDLTLNSLREFINYHGKGKINNKSDKRAKQLLSMNYGMWSNHDHFGSFSAYLFTDNFSKNVINYSKQLQKFYLSLGICPEALPKLFQVGEKYLNQEGGVLLQISERSHMTDPNGEAYNFADSQAYPCERGGYRYGSSLISTHFERIVSGSYGEKKSKVSPQLRLLLNTRHTLNPFGQLTVRRYDLYTDDVRLQYEMELKKAIRNLSFDKQMVNAYRERLLEAWQCY